MKINFHVTIATLTALMLMVPVDEVQLFATSPEITATLFHIKRSWDADEVVIEANFNANGNLCKDQPVGVFWRRFTRDGRRAPLTWLQQRLAYGVEYSFLSGNMVIFNFVSYKKQPLILKKDASGQFRVFVNLDGRQVVVDHIHVQFDGGTFFAPVISAVSVYGKEPGSNDLVVQVIRP